MLEGKVPVSLFPLSVHEFELMLAASKGVFVNKQEEDPNGLAQNAPGAKLDAGKQRPGLIMDSMARALAGVVSVGTFGANKYSDGGWLEVANGISRYRDAQLRHEHKRAIGELIDPESGLPHDFHIAWNVLAQVELKARSGVYDVRK